MSDIQVRLLDTAPRLSVATAGRGEAVVFLHGLGSTKENWEPQLRHFGRTRSAIAWDARGYGGSEDAAEERVFDRDFAGDLASVLDRLGVERAHLVGLSMGGLIAQCFYFAHPERVLSLVLAHTFTHFRDLGDQVVEGFVAARLQPLLDGADPADLAPSAAAALLGPNASSFARQRLTESLSGLRRDSYVKTVRALVAQGPAGDLTRIAVPSLVLTGEFDRLTPVPIAQSLAADIPGARLEIIADAGHLSNLERPQAFNELVSGFLDSIR